MDVGIKKQINTTTELSIMLTGEPDLKVAILKLTPFMQMSGLCGKCESGNVSLQTRRTKDGKGTFYLYMELYCKDCRAKQTFGEYQNADGAMFLKQWEEPYNQGGQPEEHSKEEPF